MTVSNVSDDVQLLSGYGLPSVQLKFIKLFVFFLKKNQMCQEYGDLN